MTDFSNQTIVITGGVSGLGLAMAHAFAAGGGHLVVGGKLGEDEGAAIAANLIDKGAASCIFDGADLRNGEAARDLVRRAEQQKGAIDVLINNAGIQHVAPIDEFPPEAWQAIVDVNLTAPFHLIAACLPAMRAAGYGRIINIASAHGLVASVHKSAYVAAKHGLVGLTKTVALEAADSDITCNAICPGFVLTPLVAQQVAAHQQITGLDFDAAGLDLIKEKHPSGRFITEQQIADIALFLADKKAGAITGTTMSVDGGWTAR
ncbi:MAG: 3-hydroxybutyrate dehydrogenase [Candidatus Puniceispirillaceae bacterium]